MSQRSKIFLGIAALLLLLIVATGAIVMQRAPEYLRQKLLLSLRSSCPACKIELGSIELAPEAGRIVFNDFIYEDSLDHETQINVRLKRLEIAGNLSYFLPGRHGPLIIRSIIADGVDFTIADDPKYNSPDENSPALSGLLPIVFQKIAVTNSTFRYVHKVSPKYAVLLLTDISGSVGSWVTRHDLTEQYAPELTEVYAKGIIEHSGDFEVKAEADPLSTQGTAHIHVDVINDSLGTSDAFFRAECGVGLSGNLLKATTDFKMKDGVIDGTLYARYNHLKIDIVDKKNSALSNYIQTIGAKFILDSEQGSKKGTPIGEKNFHDQRRSSQSLFSAIFHGLGKAAKELVKG
jgi:hypothetical protein